MEDPHGGYHDDSDAISVDSDDDDVVEFVASKKRKFAYTTFGDEDREEQTENGHDVATYGVFLDSDNDEDDRFTSRRHIHYKKNDGPSTMNFVKSKTEDSFVKEQEKTQVDEADLNDGTSDRRESKSPKELEEEAIRKKRRGGTKATAKRGKGRGK